jgi:HEPN domain-containing protein
LNSIEISNIFEIFQSASELFKFLSKDENKIDLCVLARKDFYDAAESLLITNKSINHSKWASLHATEKIIKAVLTKKGASYPKGKDGHNLFILLNIVYKIGFPNISENTLNTLQCSPSIRYEKTEYNLKDAIEAHHNSIILSLELLNFSQLK